MIVLNDAKKPYDAKLVAIYSDTEINNKFINKEKIGNVSFIDSDNTFYMYLADKTKINFDVIYNSIKTFVESNTYNICIDVQTFIPHFPINEVISAIFEAILYGYHKQWTKKTNVSNKKEYYVINSDYEEITNLYLKAVLKIESVNLARDLQDAAPNLMTSQSFCEVIKSKFKNIENLNITILEKPEIEKLQMGLFLSVNQGSCNPARLLVIEYVGNPNSKEKTTFVGKGITFDSGGYALKPPGGMMNMRYDMSGAASCISAMWAISKLKPQINVVAIAPLTDNRIGGATTLNSAIVTAMNNKTVLISNTDAEGRMVMADGITYAIKKCGATKIITVATLTGAMIQALGKHITGVVTTCEKLFAQFKKACEKSHERIWQMPLIDENYLAMSKTDYADLQNSTFEKYNPPSNAAAFLDNFTDNKPFLHIDIAGTAYIDNRGKGTMVKSLIEYCLLEHD